MKMNRFFTLGILFIGFVTLTGCKKEEGPVGPPGPAGEDANFAVGEYLVEAADFESDYAEISVDIITEDIMESGVVLLYVEDGFGYWNNVPSQFTPIIGFSFVWGATSGGILGLDHDPAIIIEDYNVRVVTMYQKTHQDLPSDEIVKDYDLLINHLSAN